MEKAISNNILGFGNSIDKKPLMKIKMDRVFRTATTRLEQTDPEVFELYKSEKKRQQKQYRINRFGELHTRIL